MKKFLTESTIKDTFINSGSTPSSIVHSVFNGDETLVSSGTMVNSGNGFYYSLFNVTTPGHYVSEVNATISGEPYRERIRFKAIKEEVD